VNILQSFKINHLKLPELKKNERVRMKYEKAKSIRDNLIPFTFIEIAT
jgi:hypothetical protein